MYNSDDSAMMSRPTYNAAERYPWVGATLCTVTLLAMAVVFTYMVASALQWRSDVQTQSAAAASERLTWDKHDWDRHDPAIARTIQIGAARER
jgi:hypothetical protein